MKTHDLGHVFCHVINVKPGTELLHWAPTNEIEPPFRTARSAVIRLFPLRKALVVGWWRDSHLGEEEALLRAVSGWNIPLDPDLEDNEVKATVRDNIAKKGYDLDKEWTIISALGVG